MKREIEFTSDRLADLKEFLQSESIALCSQKLSTSNTEAHCKVAELPIKFELSKAKSKRISSKFKTKGSGTIKELSLEKKVEGLSFPYGLFVKLTFCLLLIIVGTFSRWYILWERTYPKIEIAMLAMKNSQLYVYMNSISISMVELMMNQSDTQLSYMPVFDFLNYNIRRYKEEVVDHFENTVANVSKHNSRLITQILQVPLCEILTFADFNREPYEGCDVAFAGQATKPLAKFPRQYLNIAEQFVTEWTLCQSRADQLQLLKRDEFASVVAYMTHDQYGTGDAIYYHIVMPIYLQLLDDLSYMNYDIQISDITSISVLILVCIYPLFFIPGKHTSPPPLESVPLRIRQNYWQNI